MVPEPEAAVELEEWAPVRSPGEEFTGCRSFARLGLLTGAKCGEACGEEGPGWAAGGDRTGRSEGLSWANGSAAARMSEGSSMVSTSLFSSSSASADKSLGRLLPLPESTGDLERSLFIPRDEAED